MKVSLGGSVRENQEIRANFQHLQSILVQKLQTNFIIAVNVSPPPINVLTTQTVFTDRQITIHRSPKYSQDSEVKRQEANPYFSKTLIWLQLICFRLS